MCVKSLLRAMLIVCKISRNKRLLSNMDSWMIRDEVDLSKSMWCSDLQGKKGWSCLRRFTK